MLCFGFYLSNSFGIAFPVQFWCCIGISQMRCAKFSLTLIRWHLIQKKDITCDAIVCSSAPISSSTIYLFYYFRPAIERKTKNQTSASPCSGIIVFKWFYCRIKTDWNGKRTVLLTHRKIKRHLPSANCSERILIKTLWKRIHLFWAYSFALLNGRNV